MKIRKQKYAQIILPVGKVPSQGALNKDPTGSLYGARTPKKILPNNFKAALRLYKVPKNLVDSLSA
jgi:hypothetical protein